MRSFLVAPLLAMSLAVAPAPEAQAQDVGKAVAGLTALAIVGAILSQRAHADDDDDDDRDRDRRRHVDRDRHVDRNRHVDRGDAPFWEQRRSAARGVPARCELRNVRGDFYGERCLQRAGIRTARLPNQCRVRVGRSGQTAISSRCLGRADWRH